MNILKAELQGMMAIVNQAVRIPRFAYPMYQNAPRPPVENYAGVKGAYAYNPGFDEHEYIETEDGLALRTEGIRILTFEIMFLRDGDEIVDFDNSFYRPDVKAVMRQYGFAGPLSKSPTKPSNTELETNWEIRTGISIQFNVKRHQISLIDRMSDAKVGGIYVEGDTIIKIER